MTSVLHVITGLGSGGAEAVLTQLAIALQRQGHPQHVVSLADRGTHADELENSGVSVTALGANSAWRIPTAFARLARLVRREKPDVIQGWMYHGNIASALAHRFARKPARLMWNIRASNMDEDRYGHVIRWNERLSHLPDVVITNSRASIKFHEDLGFRPRRLVVIPNGIDVERYQPAAKLRAKVRKELDISKDAVVALNVARVDPMKDHQCFLDAMNELPEVTGLLVGSGTDELELPPNVTALGLRGDVERIHQAADLIVSSSAYGEGFSNALAEGMSSGLVPVGTDVGDAKLIVGDTGRVVPSGSPEMLCAAMEAEAQVSPGERRKRGLMARQRIMDNFTLASAVDIYARLYDSKD